MSRGTIANTSTRGRGGTSTRFALVVITCVAWTTYGDWSHDRPYMKHVALLFGVLLLTAVWYMLIGDQEERMNLREDICDLRATVAGSRRTRMMPPWLNTIRSATGTDDLLPNSPVELASPPTRCWSVKPSTISTQRTTWTKSSDRSKPEPGQSLMDMIERLSSKRRSTSPASSGTSDARISQLPTPGSSPVRQSARRLTTLPPSTSSNHPSTATRPYEVVRKDRHLQVVQTQGRRMLHLPRAYREEHYWPS